MQITMDDSHILNIAQLADFLKGSEKMPFSLVSELIDKKYAFVDKVLKSFNYGKLSKKDKRVVLWYIQKVTGYKKERVYQLVGKAEKGSLKKTLYKRVKSHKIYTSFDVKRLIHYLNQHSLG